MLLLVETKTNISIIIIIIVYLAKSTSSSKAPPASFGIPTLLSLAVLLNRIDSRRWSSFISQSIRNIISIKLQNVPLLSVCCVLRCFPHSCTPLVSRFAPPPLSNGRDVSWMFLLLWSVEKNYHLSSPSILGNLWICSYSPGDRDQKTPYLNDKDCPNSSPSIFPAMSGFRRMTNDNNP